MSNGSRLAEQLRSQHRGAAPRAPAGQRHNGWPVVELGKLLDCHLADEVGFCRRAAGAAGCGVCAGSSTGCRRHALGSLTTVAIPPQPTPASSCERLLYHTCWQPRPHLRAPPQGSCQRSRGRCLRSGAATPHMPSTLACGGTSCQWWGGGGWGVVGFVAVVLKRLREKHSRTGALPQPRGAAGPLPRAIRTSGGPGRTELGAQGGWRAGASATPGGSPRPAAAQASKLQSGTTQSVTCMCAQSVVITARQPLGAALAAGGDTALARPAVATGC